MENNSIQDILNTDIGAIVKQGKATQKKRKQIAVTVLILVLLAAGGIGSVRLYHTYQYKQEIRKIYEQEIREVEAAIDNIATEYPTRSRDILSARKAYAQLGDSQKEAVANIQKLEDAEGEVEYIFGEIIEALKYPMAKGGKLRAKAIIESLDAVTRNDVKEMLHAAISTDEAFLNGYGYSKQDLEELIP